jgi:hypothetical protein
LVCLTPGKDRGWPIAAVPGGGDTGDNGALPSLLSTASACIDSLPAAGLLSLRWAKGLASMLTADKVSPTDCCCSCRAPAAGSVLRWHCCCCCCCCWWYAVSAVLLLSPTTGLSSGMAVASQGSCWWGGGLMCPVAASGAAARGPLCKRGLIGG